MTGSSPCARDMSVRGIQAFLAENYGIEVSPDVISSVIDEVMAEALTRCPRPPLVLGDRIDAQFASISLLL